MTPTNAGNRPKTLKMNWIFVGCFVPCGLGKLWIIGMGLAFALIALAYTFCSSGVELDGDYRSSNGEYAGGYYSQAILRNGCPFKHGFCRPTIGHGRSL
ncbi:ECA polysaccharide chain length modulation protein [Escherichia coli]|nr:ECA polysaccharide chain length modulation protein [Escherichia coli]